MKLVKPKKFLGQHFLKDLQVAKDIADTVDTCPDLPILEVGPGMGVLTQFLIPKGRPVKVVELDFESVAYLRENFAELGDNIIEQIPTYKRNIKAINQNAEIIFEDKNGEVNATLEEDLPFDVGADVIDLDDTGYGIWYIDVLDNMQRYAGKTISYVGMVLHPENFPKGYFVPGRMAMTCCAEDMAFLGYACKYDQADTLKQKEWVKVTAKVAIEYFEDYGKEGPVLHAISVEKTKAPKEEVISFV